MLDLAFEDFNIDCALCFTEVRLKDFIHSNLRIVCVFARGIVEHCPVSFNLGLINWVHITEELEHVLAIEWFSWSKIIAESVLARWNQEHLQVLPDVHVLHSLQAKQCRYVLLQEVEDGAIGTSEQEFRTETD